MTRHVLTNSLPPSTWVLSGMVTSATNFALLVQPGALVGRGGAGVKVTVGPLAEVADASPNESGVSSMAAVAAGAGVSVAIAACVFATVGDAVSAGALLPQAVKIIAISTIKIIRFLFMFSLRLLSGMDSPRIL